ncbi:MAG: hypothetical protein R3B13_08710 [Polyangiaceae bacterium]
MKLALPLMLGISAISLSAHAQDASSDPTPTPGPVAPAVQPSAAFPSAGSESTATSATVAPRDNSAGAIVPRAPSTGVACVVDNFGLDPASAHTAGRMVCDEIRGQGVALLAEGVPGSETYRVSFERLGSKLIARVSYEAPTGSVVRSQRLVLDGPEEMTQAGPRLAQSVVHNRPVQEDQRVDNLVGEETRQYKKKPGEFMWGIGLGGTSVPTAGVYGTGSLEAIGYYETPRFAFGFIGHITVGDFNQEKSATYGGVTLGARYFFGDTDVSPFLGGGLGYSGMDVEDNGATDGFYGDGNGLEAFAEGGVELFRLHESRLVASVRVHAPFYMVHDNYYRYYDAVAGTEPQARSEYHLPVRLGLAYLW